MSEEKKKPVRVWVDGCFDMMHWGHANLCRQARLLGDFLVVGVHNDAEVRLNKGPPVMNENERYTAVEACKWVDQLVKDAPYYTSLEFCAKYDIDIIIHGDDVSVGADGTDTYAAAKAAGKFQTVPRTIGVSSTDLVGRMIDESHFVKDDDVKKDRKRADSLTEASQSSTGAKTIVSQFLPLSRRIVQFSDQVEPKKSDTIVYVDGGFDMFHVGHIEFLKEAKKLGSYMIVGIHSDDMINEIKGDNYPIMNVHERTLSVLSCRYVDEVIIGAPWAVSKQMIEDLAITKVVHGSIYEEEAKEKYEKQDPYADAKEAKVYQEIQSPNGLTTTDLVGRIIANRSAFLARNKKKQQHEAAINK
eukprot:CAMPEP_0168604716 /NCGR_PEP_ID=MMETSP0420-20121227/15482_1 /TAXON_ID=498008 /ORGANISM="Pessonella sp." /LENGTH=358 /DNA_ID=CAMNT_0008643925 /DNA_START=9 /DNA_END=1086 /DNA_ORIENTATION=+